LAFNELKEAAEGPNLESALSARDLLKELESALLLGAEVQLKLSTARIRWDEACSLTVVVRNPSSAFMHVPWVVAASQPAGAKLNDVEEVSRMMDAGDFLTVTNPVGRAVDMRVEPIERDAEVYQAVDLRAKGKPPTSTIAPKQEMRLVLSGFNRGWARYPMLRKGKYTVGFSYQPRWKDESWTQSGFGLVTGTPITIEVTEDAPQEVIASTTPMEMQVKRVGETFQAELVNTWDLPQWFNLNFGGSLSTHAKLEWHILASRVDNAEPIELRTDPPEKEFRGDNVVRLAPAEHKVIAHVSVAQVHDRIREAVNDRDVPFVLRSRYVHLLTPGQLREELAKTNKPTEVPVHLFTGAVSSEDVPVEK
jgi:hypothetical protein